MNRFSFNIINETGRGPPSLPLTELTKKLKISVSKSEWGGGEGEKVHHVIMTRGTLGQEEEDKGLSSLCVMQLQ